jgi:N utilization substance protein B
MSSRHRSRERALQLLYQWESSGESPDSVLSSYFSSLSDSIGDKSVKDDPFAEDLFRGVTRTSKTIDDIIERHSSNWKLERMAAIDRNVLRLAVHEMQRGGAVGAVVIDEAIELTRRFSGEKASKFVNGVLDAIRRTMEASASKKPSDA